MFILYAQVDPPMSVINERKKQRVLYLQLRKYYFLTF